MKNDKFIKLTILAFYPYFLLNCLSFKVKYKTYFLSVSFKFLFFLFCLELHFKLQEHKLPTVNLIATSWK